MEQTDVHATWGVQSNEYHLARVADQKATDGHPPGRRASQVKPCAQVKRRWDFFLFLIFFLLCIRECGKSSSWPQRKPVCVHGACTA